jgi:hypothetical protein
MTTSMLSFFLALFLFNNILIHSLWPDPSIRMLKVHVFFHWCSPMVLIVSGYVFPLVWIAIDTTSLGNQMAHYASHYLKSLWCRNRSLGLATEARACESAGQEWSLGVTFHASGNVGECEGMILHTPKWVPILGVRVLMDFWIFKKQLKSSKFIGLKSYLYHWKSLGT